MNRADKRRRRRKLVLNKLGLSLCAFAALVVLAVLGILLIRSTLLRNARDTGTALSPSGDAMVTVWGWMSISARMAPDVFCFARSSNNRPSRIKAMIILICF